MMNFSEMKETLAKRLSVKRFEHSLGVCEMARRLALNFEIDLDKAMIAGLLHDCAREFSVTTLLNCAQEYNIKISALEKGQPILLHSYIGAKIAEMEYFVTDQEILRAIRLHTTAGEKMTKLDKIIYLADAIEDGRSYAGVLELRAVAMVDLDEALLLTIDKSIQYLLKRKNIVHPDTIMARNELILKLSD